MAETPASIIAHLASIAEKGLLDDPQMRRAALVLSERLSMSLEDPARYAWRTAISPLTNMAIRIALDLNIFPLLTAQTAPVSSSFIAASTASDPALVLRILRACSSIGFLRQSTDGDGDAWSANAVTREMASKPMAAAHRLSWDLNVTAAVHGPQVLRDNGFQNPGVGGFVQRAFGTSDDLFGLLRTMPALQGHFDETMGLDLGDPEPWFRWFPVEDQLLAGLDDGAPLLVDVAGGKGHDIQAFCEAFPGRGKLVLQDTAQVLGSIGPMTLDPSVITQKHDLFTSQPVHGARAYYLHRILHDWPDSDCLRILKALRGAMRVGYSRLLIHEVIIPDKNATRTQCQFDMIMMVINGGMERSESQWTALLAEAGFEVVMLWKKYADAEGIVEAVVSSL